MFLQASVILYTIGLMDTWSLLVLVRVQSVCILLECFLVIIRQQISSFIYQGCHLPTSMAASNIGTSFSKKKKKIGGDVFLLQRSLISLFWTSKDVCHWPKTILKCTFKNQGVKEFHMMALIGFYDNIMVFSPFKVKVTHFLLSPTKSIVARGNQW